MPTSEVKEKRDARWRAEMKGHDMTPFVFIDEGGGYLNNLFKSTCRDCNMAAYVSCSIPGSGRFCDDAGGQEAGPALSDYCPVNDPERAALNIALAKERGDVGKYQRQFQDRCIEADPEG